MTLSLSDIRRLEELSRIELDPQERERLGLQLERIIAFVRVLQGASAGEGGAAPRALAGRDAAAPLAADAPGECLDREEVLAAAPRREDGFFVVPPVIETERSGEGRPPRRHPRDTGE